MKNCDNDNVLLKKKYLKNHNNQENNLLDTLELIGDQIFSKINERVTL